MKYELLKNDIKKFLGLKLYRIKYLKDVKHIKKGTLGGYIEKESNFSQNDDSLVLDNANVYGNAWVYGNAQVCGNALVCGNAQVYGNAMVYGNAWVYGDALVYGDAVVCGDARVCGNARIGLKMQIKSCKDLINIQGLNYSISLTKDQFTIGCKNYENLQDFLNRYIEEGKENKYSDYELQYLKNLVVNGIKFLNNKDKK